MLRFLFGEITDGRLARLPFLGYWILLALTVAAVVIGVGAGIGVSERLIGGDLQTAQATLRDALGVPVLILISLVFAVLVFVGANLKAKRIRDIGLPGWWTLLGIVIVGVIVSLAVSPQAAQGFSSLVLIALLLIPGNAIGRKAGQSA